jgi:hypothetical protein
VASKEEIGTMNKVLLTGRLTRDPELRSLASGSSVATFAVATNEFRSKGKEHSEFHNIVVWDRLAQVCGQYLGKRPVSSQRRPSLCSNEAQPERYTYCSRNSGVVAGPL